MHNTLTLSLPFLFSLPRRLISLKKIFVFSLFLVIALLAFYVFQVNSIISDGYQIQKYQKKISELSGENKILEINSLQVNSLSNIENKVQELGFEKTEKVHYIRLLENQVVKE